MPQYGITKNKLSRIKEFPFRLEKEMQLLIEDNVESLFGLELIKSEFQVGRLRVDSLCFDHQTKSFVIIEYKRGSSFSVIDQGYAYLALLLNNKADFILEYIKNKSNIAKEDIDWSQSRVLFVASSFTTHQQEAINFKDLPIELWELKRYENKTLSLHRIKASDTNESIKNIGSKSTLTAQVSKEIQTSSVEDHLKKASEKVKEVYESIINRISEVGEDIKINPQKHYVSLRATKNFAFVKFSKSKLTIVVLLPIKKGSEIIKHNEINKLSSSVQKFYNDSCFEIKISDDENLDEVIKALKEAYTLQN